MIGGGLSYDVYVPTADVADYQPARYTTVHTDSKTGRGTFLDYVDATTPLEHFAMPLGLDRYHDFLRHQKRARARMLELAQSVYPELASVREWPILWLNGLPVKKETSTEKIIEVEP